MCVCVPVGVGSALSKAMLDLAGLLQERDGLVQRLKADVDNAKNALRTRCPCLPMHAHYCSAIASSPTTVQCRLLAAEGGDNAAAVGGALGGLTALRDAIKASVTKQAAFVAKILEENSKFQVRRPACAGW
jgi:hypothetical protein